ncbi:MAG TPA: serine/threonine-protein kinase, partial [Kofleriaceae bacterium]|nr:serine/threonine-protein kinase [Kofleriaceae bacterium]
MKDETKVIRDLVERGLITKELGDQALSRANPDASAIDLLVKEGYLTRHVVETLLADAQEPTVIGDFKILGRLGQGGMATVYKAVQRRMHREVALKVIDPRFAINKDFCERFIREARVAGQINHPNVITCHDVGQDKGYLYMALELVTGGDAAQVAQQEGGRLPEARALRVLIDAARGLGAFARAGLIHRDIKPANIFITEDGVAKLADLGLARPSADSERMTSAGMPMGTPAYMSPEQAAGEESIDHRTDIYSLGATLFALVTGQSPFSGANALAVLAQVQKDPVPDPRRINPQVSDATAAIVAKAMAKLRDDRYPTPEDLLEDLRLAAAGRPLRHAALIPTSRWPSARRDQTARLQNPAAAPIAAPPAPVAAVPAPLDAMTLAADLRAETTPSPKRTVDWTRRMSSSIDGRHDQQGHQLVPWVVISLSAGALVA